MRALGWTSWAATTLAMIIIVGCVTQAPDSLSDKEGSQSAMDASRLAQEVGTALDPARADALAERLRRAVGASLFGARGLANDNGGTNGNTNGGTNGNDNGGTNGNTNGGGNLNDNGAAGSAGDLNCDGSVNAGDIDPFVLALTDPAGYAVAFPTCDILFADINGDGLVNAGDIDPFVILLTGGGNGNDNGGTGNLNDNGGTGNLNDNGGGTGPCPDGSTQLYTALTPGSDNEAEYRAFPAGCKRFRVRVRDFPILQTFDVTINGVVVGQLSTDDDGRGELRYDTDDGTFPANFPDVMAGDTVSVGGLASGTFSLDCSSNGNCNG